MLNNTHNMENIEEELVDIQERGKSPRSYCSVDWNRGQACVPYEGETYKFLLEHEQREYDNTGFISVPALGTLKRRKRYCSDDTEVLQKDLRQAEREFRARLWREKLEREKEMVNLSSRLEAIRLSGRYGWELKSVDHMCKLIDYRYKDCKYRLWYFKARSMVIKEMPAAYNKMMIAAAIKSMRRFDESIDTWNAADKDDWLREHENVICLTISRDEITEYMNNN